MTGLPGFFDFDDRLQRLSNLGDQLEVFGKTVTSRYSEPISRRPSITPAARRAASRRSTW